MSGFILRPSAVHAAAARLAIMGVHLFDNVSILGPPDDTVAPGFVHGGRSTRRYTGWNIAAAGFYKGHIRTNAGGYIPFAKTKAERLATGDPRLSLEERYGTHENYVEKVRAAAERLVRGRYLLQEDADRLVAEAEASEILK